MKLAMLLTVAVAVGSIFAADPVIRIDVEKKPDAKIVEDRKAVIFNGTDAKMEFPKPQGWKDFTVAFWMYPESFPGVVFCKPGYHLIIRMGKNGVAQAQAWSTDKKFLGGRAFGKMKKNVWTHLAMTYDSKATKLLLYTNGKKVASFDVPASGLFDSTSGLIFGTDAKNKTFFKGALAQVQVWTNALTPEEIAVLAKK